MPRLTLSEAYARKAKCWLLLGSGCSKKEIARQLDLDPQNVRSYLASPLPQVDPAMFLDLACTLRSARPDLGPIRIHDQVCSTLGITADVAGVSVDVLADAFRARGLVIAHQFDRRGEKRPHWWLCDYDRPLRCLQIDTVKVPMADGSFVELLSAVDVHSRAAWVEPLIGDCSLEWALSRAFAALGVPEMISTDNGLGWNLFSRDTLSDVVHYAFLCGVREFHFIPVAAPWYNGIVERFHKDLKSSWLHHDGGRDRCTTSDDVAFWVLDMLYEYNMVHSHGALSTRRNRRTPASAHGCYGHLPYAPPADLAVDRTIPVTGVVSYTRRADSRGMCRVDAPEMLFHIPSASAFGGMFRFRLDISSGEGAAYRVTEMGIEQVGVFAHELARNDVRVPYGYMLVELLSGVTFTPLPYDEVVELERQRKHLRKGRRLPLPSGYRYIDRLEDGQVVGWFVVSRSGRVITSDQHLIVDHRGEVLGDGW